MRGFSATNFGPSKSPLAGCAHWPHRDKKFRLQRRATLTVTTPSPLPSPWRQTVSSCSLATATLSLLSWLLTGMSCLFCTAQGAPWHVDPAPSWLQRSSTTRLDCSSGCTDASLTLTVVIESSEASLVALTVEYLDHLGCD